MATCFTPCPKPFGENRNLVFQGSGKRREEVSFKREEYGGPIGFQKRLVPILTDFTFRYDYQFLNALDLSAASANVVGAQEARVAAFVIQLLRAGATTRCSMGVDFAGAAPSARCVWNMVTISTAGFTTPLGRCISLSGFHSERPMKLNAPGRRKSAPAVRRPPLVRAMEPASIFAVAVNRSLLAGESVTEPVQR